MCLLYCMVCMFLKFYVSVCVCSALIRFFVCRWAPQLWQQINSSKGIQTCATNANLQDLFQYCTQADIKMDVNWYISPKDYNQQTQTIKIDMFCCVSKTYVWVPLNPLASTYYLHFHQAPQEFQPKTKDNSKDGTTKNQDIWAAWISQEISKWWVYGL